MKTSCETPSGKKFTYDFGVRGAPGQGLRIGNDFCLSCPWCQRIIRVHGANNDPPALRVEKMKAIGWVQVNRSQWLCHFCKDDPDAFMNSGGQMPQQSRPSLAQMAGVAPQQAFPPQQGFPGFPPGFPMPQMPYAQPQQGLPPGFPQQPPPSLPAYAQQQQQPPPQQPYPAGYPQQPPPQQQQQPYPQPGYAEPPPGYAPQQQPPPGGPQPGYAPPAGYAPGYAPQPQMPYPTAPGPQPQQQPYPPQPQAHQPPHAPVSPPARPPRQAVADWRAHAGSAPQPPPQPAPAYAQPYPQQPPYAEPPLQNGHAPQGMPDMHRAMAIAAGSQGAPQPSLPDGSAAGTLPPATPGPFVIDAPPSAPQGPPQDASSQ